MEGRENAFLLLKIIFSSPKNELSDVNRAFINIGNGQKFELSICKLHEVLILKFLSVVLVLMLSPTYDYLNAGEDNKKWPYDEYCDPPGSIYKCKRVYHEGVLNKFFSYCLTKIVGMLIDKPNTKYLLSLFWFLMSS